MKWVKYLILMLSLTLSYSIYPQPILEGVSFNITESEVSDVRNKFKKNITKQQAFVKVFEEKLSNILFEEFEIDSSDEAKIAYFNEYHPETISKENFNFLKAYSSKLLKSLEGIRDKKVTKDEAYQKYLKDQMSKKDWALYLKSIDQSAIIKLLKVELKKSYTSFAKEYLPLLKTTYFMDTVTIKICKLENVNKKLEQYTQEVNKQLLRSSDHTDSVIENLRQTRCKEEAKIWLKSYLEKNYQLIDEKYLGFEKYLSFN